MCWHTAGKSTLLLKSTSWGWDQKHQSGPNLFWKTLHWIPHTGSTLLLGLLTFTASHPSACTRIWQCLKAQLRRPISKTEINSRNAVKRLRRSWGDENYIKDFTEPDDSPRRIKMYRLVTRLRFVFVCFVFFQDIVITTMCRHYGLEAFL